MLLFLSIPAIHPCIYIYTHQQCIYNEMAHFSPNAAQRNQTAINIKKNKIKKGGTKGEKFELAGGK